MKIVTYRNAVAFWLLVLTVFLGCRQDNDSFSVSGSESLGRTQELRIVSLLPNATEILFELGVGDFVVGVTRYCDRPEAASRIQKVGGILDPSLETVIGTRPTVVIGSSKVLVGEGNSRFSKMLGAMKATQVPLDFETLEDVKSGIVAIGKAVGQSERAAELSERFTSGVAELENVLERQPRVSVLLIVGRNPLVVAGSGSYLGGLLDKMGMDNVVDRGGIEFPTWSLEQVLVADPDVVIDAVLQDGGVSSTLESAGVRAARSGRMVRLPDNGILRPGPSMIEAARALVEAIEKVL